MLTIQVTERQLRTARQLLRLTQSEVAERARICAQSVKDWEHSSAAVPQARAAIGRLVRVLEDGGVTFRSDGVSLDNKPASMTVQVSNGFGEGAARG
jgi:transcriptional regulator with XRE-family HTH domain